VAIKEPAIAGVTKRFDTFNQSGPMNDLGKIKRLNPPAMVPNMMYPSAADIG
jgi:hypothetical protein